jgi:hypothetical protein
VSFHALGWAAGSRVKRASDKLVLLGLADRHHTDSGTSYPSLAWLCEFSSLDRKTVISSLARLEADGLISDSGHRVGKTKQIKAYLLNLNGSEKGMVIPEPLPAKGAVFSGKQSQKRNTETVREQVEGSSNDDSPSADEPTLRPEHVFEFYQEVAAKIGRPVPRDFTPERRQLVRGRITQYGLEDFQTVFAKCRDSPFLRGDKGRTPLTFDWLMKKGNFQKTLEGNYDG